jgi:hypothetical protein
MEELASSKPVSLAENFYSDIFNYVFPENYDDSDEIADESSLRISKQEELLSCKSKDEVKTWMDDVAGEIIMRIDTEQIMLNYLGE